MSLILITSIISISKLLGNYNIKAWKCIAPSIISISKLLGNYNPWVIHQAAQNIISISKLLGNYNSVFVASLKRQNYINI